MVLRPRRPGDPFAAKWVMERIKFAREIGDQGKADELEALFDETTLRRIIETDRWDLVFDVFTSLKTSLFIPVQGYMLDKRCESCGEANQFEMPGIYISPKHPKDRFCIGGDISCPSCDSLGPFEAGNMGLMAITAELLKYNVAVSQGVKYRGPIQFLIASLHNGRLVSPRTAVQEYRRRAERDPDSVPDWLGLGNIYVHIGSRKLAAVCFGKCLALEPACAEAALSLANIRLDGGDPGGAFKLLHDAWRLHDQWRFHRLKESSPEDFTWDFVDLYNTLARKLGEPKLSMPEREPASVGGGKVGRNAPCLCGSGKKYKKCCGAV